MPDYPEIKYGEPIEGMRSVSLQERIGLKLDPDGSVALDAWPIGSEVTVTLKNGKQVTSVTESHAWRKDNKKRTVMIKIKDHDNVPVSRVKLTVRGMRELPWVGN